MIYSAPFNNVGCKACNPSINASSSIAATVISVIPVTESNPSNDLSAVSPLIIALSNEAPKRLTNNSTTYPSTSIEARRTISPVTVITAPAR